MNGTVDAVLAWDLSGLSAAAASLTVLADRLLDAGQNSLDSASRDPAWTGITKTAAHARIQAVDASLRRSARTVDAAADSVRRAHTDLSDRQASLHGLVSSLRAEGFTVASDGVVSHPDPDRRAQTLDATEQVQTVLDAAVRLDEAAGARLASHAAQLTGTDRETVTMPDGAVVRPADAVERLATLSADERRRVWASLSQSERDEMTKAGHRTIGNLDGIPFDDRIVANEMTLRDALREAERLVDRSRPGSWILPVDAAQLRSMLSDGRRFVSLDLKRNRFAEIVGEITPETTNVGVFVPGTGTALDDVDSLRRKALALSRQSGAPVIVWANGEFPKSIVADPRTDPLRVTAISGELARENAPKLVEFGRALDAELADTAPAAQTTVIGHSYGGSIVGSAEQLGLRADRIVHASSAGTGAFGDVPWTNPDPDVRRYSLTPPGDPIQYIQGVVESVHGGDPDSTPGVTRLDSGHLPADADGPRRLLSGKESHGEYLDRPDSDAFRALSDVIAGREPAPYVERAPDVPAAAGPPLRTVDVVDDLVRAAVGGLLRLAG